jgi:hypothetical protein
MALALDGSASVNNWSGSSTKTITLTTANANDLIVVVIATEKSTSTIITVSSVTAAGLTFTRRSAVAAADTTIARPNLETWTAPAATAQVALAILVTTSANVDDGCIVAFGVSGAFSIASPWDSNVALPATIDRSATTTNAPSVTVSTSQANDFIFCACACVQSGAVTAPGGFTPIANPVNSGGSFFCNLGVAYKIVSATVTSQAETFSGPNIRWVVMGDAITADAAAVSAARPVVCSIT